LWGGAGWFFWGGPRAAPRGGVLFAGLLSVAGALVGGGGGYVTTRWGWGAWHWAPIPFALAGVLLMARLWNVLPKGHER